MEWSVLLEGDAADLASLAESLKGPDIIVAQEGGAYVLRSSRIEPTDDHRAVRIKAEEILLWLNGGCRLALESRRAITACAARRLRADGTSETFAFTQAVRMRVRAGTVGFTLTRRGSTEEWHPADPVREWCRLASGDPAVSKVLRVLGVRPLDWANLYKVLEVIKRDVGGWNGIAGKGWHSQGWVDKFKRTANSEQAIGDDARHGVPVGEPPSQPMTISEARAGVKAIIHAWLGAKCSEAARGRATSPFNQAKEETADGPQGERPCQRTDK